MSVKVTARGVSPYDYEVYSDGSMKAVCVKCQGTEMVSAEKGIKIRARHEWYKDYNCYDCWKGSSDSEKLFKGAEREDSIAWGQAYNAAHEDVIASGLSPDSEDFWSKLAEYQRMHYEFIKKQINIKHEDAE